MSFYKPSRAKPRNWQWKDGDAIDEYNKDFRLKLGYPEGLPDSRFTPKHQKPDQHKCYRAFSDGSFKQECLEEGAGWGYTIFRPEPECERSHYRLFDRCGSVLTSPKDVLYLGAESHSNISGELTATTELMWHILSLVNDGMFNNYKHLIIFVDCIYVKNVLLGKCTVTAHPLLVTLAQHLWKRVNDLLVAEIRWCKGHSGNTGNSGADPLANKGRESGRACNRPRLDNDIFDTADFQNTLQDLQMLRPRVFAPPNQDNQNNRDPKRPRTEMRSHRFSISPFLEPNTKNTPSRNMLEDDVITVDSDNTRLSPNIPMFEAATRICSRRLCLKIPMFVDATIFETTKAIRESAFAHGKPGQAAAPPTLDPQCDLLRRATAFRAAADCADPVQRMIFTSRLLKIRRAISRIKFQLTAEWRLHNSRHRWVPKRPPRFPNPPKLLCPYVDGCVHVGGHRYREVNGPREKQQALTSYFTSLVGTTNNKAGLPDWVFKTWSVEDISKLPALSNTLLRIAVLKLGTNKSSREDAIIGEFFKEMDDTNLEIIGVLFRVKLLNVGGGGGTRMGISCG